MKMKRPLRAVLSPANLALIGLPKKFRNVTIEDYIAYEYFMRGKKTRYDVEKMAKKLNCSTSTMYRKIKNTRQNIKQNALRDGGA